MKNKGFTLIELLAVIVIIGIIAVITIPKIKDALEDSKREVAKASAYSYKKAISEYTLRQQLKDNIIELNDTYQITESGYLNNGVQTIEINVDGEKPKNGYLTYNNNELTSGCITFNKYKITFQNGEVANIEKGDCETTKLLEIEQYANAYITEFKNTTISVSGVYNVPDINEDVTVTKYPTNGWIKIEYSETGSTNVLSYSLKFDSYAITYDGTNKTLTPTTAEKPAIECPDPTCTVDDYYGNITLEHKTNVNSTQTYYVCDIKNNKKYCLEGGTDESESSTTPIYNKNKEIIDKYYTGCNYNSSTATYSCSKEIESTTYAITIKKDGFIKIESSINSTNNYCKIDPADENTCVSSSPEV